MEAKQLLLVMEGIVPVKIKKNILEEVIKEAMGATKMLDTLAVRLVILGSSHDIKVEEIVTAIRVIEGVATVVQDGAIYRTPNNKRVINLKITFDSMDREKSEYIEFLVKSMKTEISSVDRLLVKTLNDKEVKTKDGKRVAV